MVDAASLEVDASSFETHSPVHYEAVVEISSTVALAQEVDVQAIERMAKIDDTVPQSRRPTRG